MKKIINQTDDIIEEMLRGLSPVILNLFIA